MKSLILLGFAILCVSTLAVPQPQKLNVRALMRAMREVRHTQGEQGINGIQIKTELKQANNGSDVLCESCKHVFSVLKDIVGDINNMTKDTLTNALNVTCKYLEGSVPFIDQVCEECGPKFIDILYKYLIEVDKEIDPEHDCKLLLLCWGDKKSQKQAFQEMVLKNKIRFD